MKYTIISGTGRAGTTLLTKILTRAGLDTGFALDHPVDPVAHAGWERMIGERPGHRIIKSPWIALELDRVLAEGDVSIEHAILCIRDLHSAAESRRRVQVIRGVETMVAGGLWETKDPEKQEEVLAGIFYSLVHTLSVHEVPMTFLHFPRFAEDSEYAIRKLLPIFPEVGRDVWLSAMQAEVRRELIHRYPATLAPVLAADIPS